MPEKVLFESEQRQSRTDVAAYLRQIADKLADGEPMSLTAGEQRVTMAPPESVEFEVKAEREGPADGAGELSVEFELEWPEDSAENGDGEFRIE